MTVAGSVIVDVMRYLLTKGVNAELVCREAGVDPGVVYAPDREISGEATEAFWVAAEHAAHDPTIGLHVGEATLPSMLGVAGYAIVKSDTFGEALRKAMTYMRLVNRGVELEVRREGPWATLACTVSEEDTGRDRRHSVEAAMGAATSLFRSLTGEDLEVGAVSFQHDAPENTREHKRVFGIVPRFSQDSNRLLFPSRYLDQPLRAADTAPLSNFGGPPAAYLAEHSQGGPHSARAREMLVALLFRGLPTIEDLATGFGKSVSTVRKYLRGEGTTFKELLTEVRRELALRYLASADVTLHQVAFLLGFADTTAFAAAFEKWTGKSPDAYREASAGSA